MTLGNFLSDQCTQSRAPRSVAMADTNTALGSWADEMEDMPVARKCTVLPLTVSEFGLIESSLCSKLYASHSQKATN